MASIFGEDNNNAFPTNFNDLGQLETWFTGHGIPTQGEGAPEWATGLFESLREPPPSMQWPDTSPGQGQQFDLNREAQKMGYRYDPISKMFKGANVGMGSGQMVRSPQDMQRLIQLQQQRTGQGGRMEEATAAARADLANTEAGRAHELKLREAMRNFGIGLSGQLGNEVIQRGEERAGVLKGEADRLEALGGQRLQETRDFTRGQLGEVQGLVQQSIANAQGTLAKFETFAQGLRDTVAQQTAMQAVGIWRSMAPAKAELEAQLRVQGGTNSQLAAADAQLNYATGVRVDQAYNAASARREQIDLELGQATAALGGQVTQAQQGGAEILAQTSAQMGSIEQQAIAQDAQYKQLSASLIADAEQGMSDALLNAAQLNMAGLQFASQLDMDFGLPSFFTAVLGLFALPKEIWGQPATGVLDQGPGAGGAPGGGPSGPGGPTGGGR